MKGITSDPFMNPIFIPSFCINAPPIARAIYTCSRSLETTLERALVLAMNSRLECKRSHPRCGAAWRISRASKSACSPRDISLRKGRIVYCSAVKSGRGTGAVSVNGGRIKSGRNDDIEGERERKRGRARNKVQERSAATFWR